MTSQSFNKERACPPEQMSCCSDFLKDRCERAQGFKPKLKGKRQPACQTPWITPILGTGCTPEQVNSGILVKVIRGLGEKVNSRDDSRDKMRGSQVKIFAIDLVRERLATTKFDFNTALESGDMEEVPEWMAEVFTIASLLTYLFHQLKFLTGAAPRRYGHDDSLFLDNSLNEWVLLEEDFIAPSRIILNKIHDDSSVKKIAGHLTNKYLPWAKDDLKDFSSRIMNRLKKHIERTSISLRSAGVNSQKLYYSDVQWWAELAWLMIAGFTIQEKQIASYPRWADLLIELCCFGNVDDCIYPSIVGKPIISHLFDGSDVIKSKCSSDILSKLIGDNRPEFKVYEEVANMLIAQTYFRLQNYQKAGAEPPIPSAFVTSFDLELEIAIIRQLKNHEKILIAFPVYLSNTQTNVIYTFWMALEVERVDDMSKDENRKEQLRRIMHPELEQFCTLSYLNLKEMNCPIIVRLSGCPLIDLPIVSAENKISDQIKILFSDAFLLDAPVKNKKERDDFIKKMHESLVLNHAIIVSEHSAMIHNVIDLLHTGAASSANSNTKTAGEATSGQLNPGLSSDVAISERDWVRFWILLGVQVEESAIRRRVGTLLSVLPRSAGTRAQQNETHSLEENEIRGVAFNQRITALEADFLAWNDLVVITNNVDDCFELLKKQINNFSL